MGGIDPLLCGAGTPAQHRASVMDASVSPQMYSAAGVPSLRASPLLKPGVDTVAKKSRSPAGEARSSLLGKPSSQGSYSAQHLHTARIAKVTQKAEVGVSQKRQPSKNGSPNGQAGKGSPRASKQRSIGASPRDGQRSSASASSRVQQPANGVGSPAFSTSARPSTAQRPSRLAVKTPFRPASAVKRDQSSEEQPLKVHHTPFNVRCGLCGSHSAHPAALERDVSS